VSDESPVYRSEYSDYRVFMVNLKNENVERNARDESSSNVKWSFLLKLRTADQYTTNPTIFFIDFMKDIYVKRTVRFYVLSKLYYI